MQLLEWWNLIFELPFLVSFVIVLVMAMGLVPMGEGGGDSDHDVHAELAQDVGHDLGHEIDHDMGAGDGHAAEHQSGFQMFQVATLLGVGKVPMAIILMSLSVIWGFVGWTGNQLLSNVFSPIIFVPISIVLALVCAVVFTRYLAMLLARLVPSVETYAVTHERLIGKTGEARYDITETFGEAFVRDRYGQLHLVTCRTLPGNATIPSGTKLVLYKYDSDHDLFYAVTPVQFDILGSQLARTFKKEA